MAEKKSKSKNKKIKVLFVCTGNTCRSPMAEYIFKDFLKSAGKADLFKVSSAGLAANPDEPISENAVAALKDMGIKAGKKKAIPLTRRQAESADLIVCMTDTHRRAVEGLGKTVTVASLTGGKEVSDPYGKSLQDYKACAEYLRYAAEDIYSAAINTAEEQNHKEKGARGE